MREFWELVIQKKELDFEGEPENFLRQAFSSEKFAKDRAEEDNRDLRRCSAPIKWKNDHHGGYESVDHPKMFYFVFPRTIFPMEAPHQSLAGFSEKPVSFEV